MIGSANATMVKNLVKGVACHLANLLYRSLGNGTNKSKNSKNEPVRRTMMMKIEMIKTQNDYHDDDGDENGGDGDENVDDDGDERNADDGNGNDHDNDNGDKDENDDGDDDVDDIGDHV